MLYVAFFTQNLQLLAITLNHIEVMTSYRNQNLSVESFSGADTKAEPNAMPQMYFCDSLAEVSG